MEEIKIFQLAERYHKLFPKKDMLAIQKNGVLKTYSTEDYIETTNNIAYGLKHFYNGNKDLLFPLSIKALVQESEMFHVPHTDFKSTHYFLNYFN